MGEGVQREVEETLHAVLADPEAARAWAAGRLVRPLKSTFGFPQADVLESRPSEVSQRAGDGRREDREGSRRKKPGGKAAEHHGDEPGDKAAEHHGDEPGDKAAPHHEDEPARRRRIKEARRAARDAEGAARP